MLHEQRSVARELPYGLMRGYSLPTHTTALLGLTVYVVLQ